MNILILTSSLDSGGAETHIFDLATSLFGKNDRITVASRGGRISEKLKRLGIEHTKIRLDSKNPFILLASKRRLIKIIKSENIDVIHAHSRISAFVAHSVSRRLGIPMIVTLHAKFSLSPIPRHLSRWGTLTIAVSEDLRDYLCSNYQVSPENTRVIENGIDILRFYPSAKKERGHRILFVSRLDYDCSLSAFLLCKIAPRLKEEFPDIKITLCGGGEAYGELYRIAKEINSKANEDFIFLCGHTDKPEELLGVADLFVGVSRGALEAMSCETPVILSGNEGYIGLLRDREDIRKAALSNFCCRGNDSPNAERLFSDICEFFRLSDDKKEGIGRILREYVREYHSREEIAKKTLSVYNEALSRVSGKKSRIILCGYYGFGNMGDNALLRATVKRVRALFGEKSITALTRSPRKDSAEFGIRCINRVSPLAIIRELRGAKVLVLGGGTLLQDTTSLRSLFYYWSIIALASKFGLRIELWGNGIGAPKTKSAQNLIRDAIKRADRVGLRDMPSVTEALKIMRGEDIDKLYYEQDLAYGQESAQGSRIDFLLDKLGIGKNADNRFAVIAVRGTSGKGYIKILAEWLETLSLGGIRLIFIPMFPKEDLYESRRLALALGGIVAEGLSESDTVGIMSQSCVVCGMRLHSLIFAHSASVPFVGFGADPKIESFCRENGGLYFTELY